MKYNTFYLRICQKCTYAYSKSYLLDLVLVLGLYSWDSSSMPFCLLYQSNKVRRIEGRQYSESELIELITYGENTTNQWINWCSKFPLLLKKKSTNSVVRHVLSCFHLIFETHGTSSDLIFCISRWNISRNTIMGCMAIVPFHWWH